MNFFANKIVNPAGTGITFSEYLEKLAAEKENKSNDSTETNKKIVINNDNEDGSHSYQEGESVDGKSDQKEGKSDKKEAKKESSKKTAPKQAHCKKDMGESDKAGKITEEHSDAENAEIGEGQVSQKINNDPNYQKGESTNPSKAKSKKVASNKSSFKKIASLNHNEKIKLFANLSMQRSKNGIPQYPIQYVEAMVGLKFSNLKDDEKKWFKKYWDILYPRQYVEEMVADR